MKTIRIILGLTMALACLSCSKESLDTTEPELTVPPVELSEVNQIIAFGQTLGSSVVSPAIEYITNSAEDLVFAVLNGYVVRIEMNTNFDDYELWIKPSLNSDWTIIYDHVLNITVSVDDEVLVGDTIGTIGINNRTEFQVNRDSEDLSYCPLSLGTHDFVEAHENAEFYLSGAYDWCLTETVVP